ncbi:NADH-dependent [FeFe] hydrogenase, group A6 [Allofournierella massiliensis]|uniref:NADP-reducing hydrogenase subunit HndD n=1 Tax=Allofournierella massiliensis TaxID=1650663 RepID=A0A4R1R2G0_9FIRM|nr:NADH-dependent [FeFe] hydrogenase, group A6 [Fournierella massiliensis]TCL59565.1 NADP-reducing hydrogenase subunit HndD [Fournierella massiliensis]
MNMVNLKINNVPCQAPEGSTILEAAHAVGITIPTLCYLKEIKRVNGACRVCVVEVKGAKNLLPACVYPVSEGMEVFTNTKRVQNARKMNLELILSIHNQDCMSCVRNGDCELLRLCKQYGVDKSNAFEGVLPERQDDDSAPHLVKDSSKCIICRRCISTCAENQGVGVINVVERGFNTHIACAFEGKLADSTCIGCGQCIVVCPTAALVERDDTEKVWAALDDPTRHVVVQTAPSVRAALGEEFGLPIGTNVQGKMVAALRRLGFDGVFDTDFAADMTIMEEAHEFLERVKNGGKLPLITSCSPGWVKYCETFHPDFIPNLSSCKSPQQMFGALSKTYYAEKMGLDPRNVYCVSVMPCTAKKFEIGRPDQSAAGDGIPDVDVAITTRELARMIHRSGLRFNDLPDEDFDPAMGQATGAGHIFGATGGVMEAALRTAVETLTGEKVELVEFTQVRGTDAIKEAEYQVAGLTLRVCVVSGTANAGKVLDMVRSGEKQYDMIEVMACPGGCVNGGGQPIQPAPVRNFTDIRALRAKALYDQDEASVLRRSHENPLVQQVYAEFLGEPGSEKAHHILHTSYAPRPRLF